MRLVARWSFVVALTLTGGVAAAQTLTEPVGKTLGSPGVANSNPIFPTNGGEVVFVFDDPSVGGVTPGSVSPGDNSYWKILPAASIVNSTPLDLFTLENLFVGDTDWTTSPRIHDMGFGLALDSGMGAAQAPQYLPDFFSTGSLSTLISIGPSGLPDPCSVIPSMCSTPGCPPALTGYEVDILLGGGAPTFFTDGVDATAMIVFLPGGMTFTSAPGTCGMGDYEFTGAASTDEHQADSTLTGESIVTGFNGLPSGRTVAFTTEFGFQEPVIENVSESLADLPSPPLVDPYDGGYPLEAGVSGLALDTAGIVNLGVRVHAVDNIGDICFVAASTALLPFPITMDFMGTIVTFQIDPSSPLFMPTLMAWSGTGLVMGIDGDGDTISEDGIAQTITLTSGSPLFGLAGATIYTQAFFLPPFPLRGPPLSQSPAFKTGFF